MCANFQGKSLFQSNGLTGKWYINENCLLVLSLSFSNTPAPITETGQVHNFHLLFTCQSVAWKKRVAPKTCTWFVLYYLNLHSFELFVCFSAVNTEVFSEMFNTVGCQQELAISFLSWKGHCPFLFLLPLQVTLKLLEPNLHHHSTHKVCGCFKKGNQQEGMVIASHLLAAACIIPRDHFDPILVTRGHSLARQDHCYQFPHHSLHQFQTTSLWHQVAVWPDSVVCLHLLP